MDVSNTTPQKTLDEEEIEEDIVCDTNQVKQDEDIEEDIQEEIKPDTDITDEIIEEEIEQVIDEKILVDSD